MKYLGSIKITVQIFVLLCWTFVTQFFIHKFVYYTTLIFILDSCRRISHNYKIKNKKTLIFYWNTYFSDCFSSKTVRLNIIILMFYQILSYHCSLLHNQIYHIIYSPKYRQVIGTTHSFQHVSFRNRCLA